MKTFLTVILLTILFLGINLSVLAQEPIPVSPFQVIPTAPPYPPEWTVPYNPPPIYPTGIPQPTPAPVGFYTIRVQWQTLVCTCLDYACFMGHVLKVGTVINVQAIGGLPGWLWIKSGDFVGQFIHDDGSFQRL